MSKTEIRVPDLGGSQDVDVIELAVSPGDQVVVDDPLIVLESDKATMEVPSPIAGTVVEMRVAISDKVSEGDLIAIIDEAEAVLAAPKANNEQDIDANVTASDALGQTASSSSSHVVEITVPDLGGAASVEVVEISVAVGDSIAIDDSVVVVETDKATMELPSTVAGSVQAIHVSTGDKLAAGDKVATILADATNDGGIIPEPMTKVVESHDTTQLEARPLETRPSGTTPSEKSRLSVGENEQADPVKAGLDEKSVNASASKVHAGPAVRKVAREFGVDLLKVTGSGQKGRILKEDVQNYVRARLSAGPVTVGGSGVGLSGIKLPDFAQFGVIERKPMSRIHQATATNMQASWLTVPHVTQFDEADITELEAFRKQQKSVADARGSKLTPMPFLLKACAWVMARLPQFNVSLDMDAHEVVQKHYLHIGVAVDTPHGLMVPVIRDVDQKSIWQLADELTDMALKAKQKQLKPADMQGGCFTISSLGGIGGTAFTPIVNTPEVAILGVSKAAIKPVWQDEAFVPRLLLPLSLSYDHRAVNGADAARFTSLLGQVLGDIRQLLL